MTLSGACKGNYSAPERSIVGYPRASWQVPPVVVGTAAGRDAYAIRGLPAPQDLLNVRLHKRRDICFPKPQISIRARSQIFARGQLGHDCSPSLAALARSSSTKTRRFSE